MSHLALHGDHRLFMIRRPAPGPGEEMAVTSVGEEVLGSFHGSDEFQIEWEEGEEELFWILDDLHCPNPISPMFFDIGGWWLTCDHMFRRFGTPFASDWIAKRVNGYLYTAAVPADPSAYGEASEYGSRYVPRVPESGEYAGKIGAYLGSVLPHYAYNFLDWWRERLRPEMDRNFAYLDGQDTDSMDMVELAVLLGCHRYTRPALEDPLDAQLRPVLGDDSPKRDDSRGQG